MAPRPVERRPLHDLAPETLARFEAQWMPEPNSGCWLWLGAVQKRGYGNVRIIRRGYLAHRVAWSIHRGPIPTGMWVLHRCDNPSCVNPDHLFLGNHAANMADMAAKGRHWSKTNPEKVLRGDAHPARINRHLRPRGERHGRAKLTAAKAAAIRVDPRSGRAIGVEYGVSSTTVFDIKNGKRWPNV